MCLAVPGQILKILDYDQCLATVELSGVRRAVSLSLLADDHGLDAWVGEWVLVHVGFALERVDAAEARATLDLLKDLAATQPAEVQQTDIQATPVQHAPVQAMPPMISILCS